MGMAGRSALACVDCSCQLHSPVDMLLHCKDTAWRCERACKGKDGSEEETFLCCSVSILVLRSFMHCPLIMVLRVLAIISQETESFEDALLQP